MKRRPFGLTLRLARLPSISPQGRGEAVVLQLGDASGERDVRVDEPPLISGPSTDGAIATGSQDDT